MRLIWQKINLFLKTQKKSKLAYKGSLIIFVVLAIYLGNMVFFPQAIPKGQQQIVVNKDENLFELATELKKQKVIKNRGVFLILLRAFKKDKKVTAGLYFLKYPMSTWGLIQRITNGQPDQVSITFLDGWTFDQLRNYVDRIESIKHITKGMTESELKLTLKIDAPSLEGFFYPSTYFIAPGQTDLEIYQQSHKIMQNKLIELYEKRNAYTVYRSTYELLIMASLIEKETSDSRDRYLVSTVFNNRIRSGMKLQDDPSVFYGLRKYKKNISSRFQFDTPYNTYLHFGLPPTPICIPSEKSIIAASQPENKPNLYYFVAIGSGKTKFSSSYNEHLIAVNKYLKKTAIIKNRGTNSVASGVVAKKRKDKQITQYKTQ